MRFLVGVSLFALLLGSSGCIVVPRHHGRHGIARVQCPPHHSWDGFVCRPHVKVKVR